MESKYKVGDFINLVMMKPEMGKKPISRTDTGLICLIHSLANGFYQYNSIWKCEIKIVADKYLVVYPEEEVMNAKDHEKATMRMIKEHFGKSDMVSVR